MASWRDEILNNFEPNISPLTLVADPDGLLIEEGMISAIQERGFDLLAFEDAISFRFAYESRYRKQAVNHKSVDVVVLLRTDDQLNKLPYDILKAGRHLAFALHKIFPKLNYAVIAGLDRLYLDNLYEAYQSHNGEQLTERETKNFVLMQCFGIVPILIKKPVDLLKVLLSLHSRKVRLPDFLIQHVLEHLKEDSTFDSWPLAELFSYREKFLLFLQEEWKLFLALQDDPTLCCRVQFNHEDVRAYIDTMFLDGSLLAVEYDGPAKLPAWMQTGVFSDHRTDSLRRFRGLWKKFEEELPGDNVSHQAWQLAAIQWAELIVLRWECDASIEAAERSAWHEFHTNVEDAFSKWMQQRYGTLHNLAHHQKPVMVHQISRFMASERARKNISKVVLLVLDGLAIDQWLLLKKNLEASDKAWRFQESTAFAWVPTLTSISRQSIFAGEPPLYFPNSLSTTSKEKSHWLRFWEDHGVQRARIDLVTSLDGPLDPKLDAALGNARLEVLGIVWNKVDDIMHGMQMQTAGMHNQVRLWAQQGHLQQLLLRLTQEGFAIYLTADHGNITAKGIGNPREGVLAETKGNRARIYDRVEFLEDVANKYPESLTWPNHGMPPECHVLVAGKLTAFAALGDEVVSHGGISLEEVMVPFVRITREDECGKS